jgi:outer membrane protein assembly factor BamB
MEPYRGAVVGSEVDCSVVVVALRGAVVGLERATGQIRWDNELVGGGGAEVAIGFRYGVLAVSAAGGLLYRLDYLTGATLWHSPTTSAGRATILVEHDLIIVGKGGYLDAFDHGGRRVWQQKLAGKGMGRLALAVPGNVAQADDPGGE